MQLSAFKVLRKNFLVEKIFKMLLCLYQQSQETLVMPMEIFVSARVGLAALGGVRIALDLGLHSTLFYFYPSLVCETLEGEILPWRYVCGLAEFLN